MDRETAKEIVKGYLEDYLRNKGINTRKPFNCLNPDHPDKHPSMSYDRQRQRCKCFSCGASYDIFDLIGIDYGLADDKAVFEKAYNLYGLTIDSPQQERGKVAPAQPAQKPQPEDHTEYYKQAAGALAGSPAAEYLKRRGISEAVAAKYWLGYEEGFKTFDADETGQQRFSTWRALIIPTGKSSYIARNIDTPIEPQKKNRYRKKGASLIFNSRAIYSASKPVFVVEGEIDALSIIEAGGEAIGLGSTSNYKQLVDMIKAQPPAQPLILALDADEDGQKTEKELAEELTRLQASFYRYNLYGAAKDANEALLADRDGFIAEITAGERAQEAELEAVKEAAREEYLKTNAAAYLQDFLDGIKEAANTPAISTGFSNLDSILDGGLYEGLYIIGAISSLGKTTLALQIADQIADSGRDVLIFSLEMARSELIAKSISRLTYFAAAGDTRNAKTNRGITAGARYAGYSETERAIINKALAAYKKYAQHIYIHEGIGDIGIERVKEVVQQHISITGNKPIVFIDYLQILAPYDMRSTDKQNTDKAVLELKRLSRDLKIPVIGVSSFNRDSYKEGSGNKGRVTQADFKESGAIEYSADVLIGLEFASAGSKEYSEKAEKRKDPREIRLVVLKNRNGKAWEAANFKYHSLFNYYEEDGSGFTELPEDAEDPFKDMRGSRRK